MSLYTYGLNYVHNHFHYFAGIIQQAMGYSVELTCHVEAYPKPTINWVHEGIQLSTNQVSFTLSLSGFYDQSHRGKNFKLV